MRIYLASRYSRRLELCQYAGELAALGHVVTSRWLAGTAQYTGAELEAALELEAHGDLLPQAVVFAAHDIEDILDADTLIAFAPGGTRGGWQGEVMFAWARHRRVIVVGPTNSCFHLLPGIERFATWEECREALVGHGVLVETQGS